MEDAANKIAFVVPKDIMEADWTGHKYVTSHRCFGSPCKDKTGKDITDL